MKKILLLILFPIIVFSQTTLEKKAIITKTNITKLKNIAEKSDTQFKDNKRKAQQIAKIKNWPLFTFKDSVFSELIAVSNDLKPIYYSTYNEGAGITSRANKLHSGGSLGLNINGENMTAAVWDAGSGMPSHQLFSGRLQLMDNSPNTHYHSAHVAGTIIGSEMFQNGVAKGMAYKGNVKSYDWNSDIAEVATAASNGLLVSNHSYGRNPGGVATSEWGKYDVAAQSYDEIMFNAPYYQFVCAAGNSRIYGVNTIKNGYDLLSGHATSKNGITVAAVNELLNYTGPSSVIMSSFSSWGATDDGRIKPDIAAKGVDTFSASDESVSSYTTLSGTSMASPSVGGTLLLFQQYYKQLNDSYLKAATLKGLMIHTADEAGISPGPDYQFGWGLINAEKAADVITKNQTQAFILENTLNQSDTYTISVNALGDEPLVATLCWTDPKGNIPSGNNDDPAPNLINNLDLRITQNNNTHFPWKLNGNNVSSPATQEDNDVDNVEKVEINNASGSYLITVNHKGTLLNNLQNYSLIISGVTARDFWTTTLENSKSICEGLASITYDFTLHTKANFNETVTFSTVNLPNNVMATFNPDVVNSAGNFTMTLSNLNLLLPGSYSFTVKTQTATDSFENEITLNILSPNIAVSVLTQPTNNTNSIALPTVFNWIADSNAQSYDIQIATDSNFITIIQEANVTQNHFTSSLLNHNSIYFWRVRAKNLCNIGEYSTPFNFSTVCGLPSNVVLNSATTTGAVINWGDTFSPNSWEIELTVHGTPPTGTGTIVTNPTFTFSELETNTCYDFYVRSNCGNGSSSWTEPFAFCTEPNYCGGDHFYDTGGIDGNYQNNESYTKTIFPDIVGNRVKAVFNTFNIESGWDYLTIFNGPDTNSPVLFSGTGTSITNTLASTHASGALTFHFFSDNIINTSGWDASIICEPMPACPNTPTNSTLLLATYTSAIINWEETGNLTSWEIELVPHGTTPTGIGTIVANKPYTASDLISNTSYDFYVRSICSNGNSDWSIPMTFKTKSNWCGGDHFLDSGGLNGDYPLYEYQVTTLYPETVGDRITATFDTFQLNNYASFRIFNGTSTSNPILFESDGTNAPNIVSATNMQGALTVEFYVNSNVTASGWDASIVCEPLPPCPNPPSYIYLNNVSTTTATFSWFENSNAISWQIEIVPHGVAPTGVPTYTSSNPYLKSGLTANTWYDFYVRSQCSNGNSDWSAPFVFHTEANYCLGDHFYDEGGPNENYPVYDSNSKTIYPSGTGNRIKAVFNAFEIGANTNFVVYNGQSAYNSPILYSSVGNDLPPATLTATNPQGALTFVFSNYSNDNAPGWDATIVCEPLPPCSNAPTYITLYDATGTTATLNWTENANATSWDIEIVPHGTPQTGSTTIATSKPYTKTGLTTNTWYDFYVRSRCGSINSTWVGPIVFNTMASYCAGDHFYDTGGPNGNYQSYGSYTKTIYPSGSGNRIKATFNTFLIDSNTSFNVYNSPNSQTQGTLIYSNNGGNASPGTLTATNPSGALTFVFWNNQSTTAEGWDASIICEPLPPCSNAPSNIYLNTTTTTSATFNWTENANAASWDIEIVPHGSPQTGTTNLATSRPYTKTGLTSNTWYDFYVRSRCGAVNSVWSGPFSFNTKANYCAGDHFYDSGGPNENYLAYENKTVTITPTNSGDRVKAIFNAFQIGNNNNTVFKIYNAPSSYPESALIYSSDGVNTPGTLTATNPSGAMTFVFQNYSANTATGWDASIICEPLPPCSNSPSNIYLNSISTTTASFSWTENSNASSWEIEIVAQGALPSGAGSIISSNPYTKTGLTSNTWYAFYIRSKCGAVNSTWTGPFHFNTNANYCAGDHFYDLGGPNGNYESYEYQYTTIYPSGTGNRIKATFDSFLLNNNDSFSVFNGTSTSGELLFSRDSSNPISPTTTLTATNIQGALTFYFNGGYQTNEGWDASIICEPLPPCSSPPSSFYSYNTTTTSANLSWAENSNASSWEIEIVPQGTLPSGSGNTISSNPYTATSLTSNSWYDVYIRSKCGTANSTWSGPYHFHTKANYCSGDHFYDNGGPNGNYPNSDSSSVTINPSSPGQRVKAIFNTFQLAPNDSFIVYDGPNTSYPIVYNYNSNNSPGTITATDISGTLTFRFYSYASINPTYSGWDADIICDFFPACSFKPTAVTASGISSTSAILNWTENSNATSWEYEIVLEGTIPTGSGIISTTNNINLTSLNENSCYTAYVRSICANSNSSWSLPYTFCTTPNYCANNHFYDTGGPNGNYQDYENYTTVIYPETLGYSVQAIFNSFQMESCCDRLKIYNGPDTNAPILFNSGSVSPGTKTSTHPSGALTFVFTSDSSSTGSGWDATINCAVLATTENEYTNAINYYPNPTSDILYVNSKHPILNYQVYDINMRLIADEKIDAVEFEIQLSKYTAGVYFIKLVDIDNRTKEIKVLKK
jgi:hypothetical protein